MEVSERSWMLHSDYRITTVLLDFVKGEDITVPFLIHKAAIYYLEDEAMLLSHALAAAAKRFAYAGGVLMMWWCWGWWRG